MCISANSCRHRRMLISYQFCKHQSSWGSFSSASLSSNHCYYLPTKVHIVKAMVFPVVMYGCEGWAIKNAERWRIDAFELRCWRRLLRVPWTERRSNKSILKEITPEYSLERLMVEAEAPILWPPDTKSWLIGKASDDRKHWRWEEKGVTKDEMVEWHHLLNGHECEWTLGNNEGQGSWACCSTWDHKELDMTERLNNKLLLLMLL